MNRTLTTTRRILVTGGDYTHTSMSGEIHVDLPQVLLVDDEKEVADAYALRLEGVAEVTIAYGGQEALDKIDPEAPPDVVLLDRHMPGTSGDDVLEALQDMDFRTRVIMVTAIDPGLDIVDLPFDEYLCKPVEREDVQAAVDQQCQVLAYELLGEFFQLEAKRAVIEAELPPEQLETHEEFTTLEQRTDRLQSRAERLLPEADKLISEFTGIDREGY